MDPIPLNAVRAAAADTAVPVADIADAAADVAADARAVLAGAAADTSIVAAAVDSAGDLYRRACRVRRHCGLHVPRSARRFSL